MSIRQKTRLAIQIIATGITNCYVPGFIKGRIYQGGSKKICVPGLNCYSCPGAVGSCPIGSLQNALCGYEKSFPYYVTGILLLFGVFFGRLICGFLCPFGLLQDLLHKIPVKKIRVPEKADEILRLLKYGILLVLVIELPLLWRDAYGMGDPWFCKYLCPQGTLEGGIFLMLGNPELRSSVGLLFAWKCGLLILCLILMTMIYRPFCKYICPLGAIYGFFNRFSLYRLEVDEEKCTHCGACETSCPMQVKVLTQVNSAECIRCGKCMDACTQQAVNCTLFKK